MKKFIVLLLVIGPAAAPVRAQSISDLITQLVLDTQKLSELRAILHDMYTGYQTLDKGYTAIKNIAEGNFNLHRAYLDGLLAISPAVQHYPRVTDILDAEYSIVSESRAASNQFYGDGHFTPQEHTHINDTYSALFRKSQQSIDELTLLITADQLRMSDAQRLQAIDRVYTAISEQLGFLRQFNNNTALQSVQRAREAGDIGTLQAIYGIKNQ